MIRESAHPRWTRAHERFAKAVWALQQDTARRNGQAMPQMPFWIRKRWSVVRIIDMTPAQCRHGARQLNAWRFWDAGYLTPPERIAA